jgi:hypothetical protein
MKQMILLLAFCGLIISALSAGCTSPTNQVFGPVATPSPTPEEVLIPPTGSAMSLTPEAIVTLPPEQFVNIAITKERPDATIHLLYNGGPGEISVQSILMRVTRSDGKVIEGYLNDNARKPRRGDELVIPATRGNDRVEVYVTSAGKIYRVYDQPIISLL